MKKCISKIITSLTLFLALPFILFSQEFPCDGSIYYVGTNTVVGSKLYKLSIDENSGDISSRELPLENPDGRHITCLGYNVRDKMLYGLDFNTYELLRIGSDGSLTNLGLLDELDQSFSFHSGGMTPDGRRLLLVARNKTSGLDERMYSVRINEPNFPTGFFALVTDNPVTMTDLATDPIFGSTLAFDLSTKAVVVTSPTGQTFTNLGYRQVSQIFGSLFFDRKGNFYGLGNAGGVGAEQSQVYAIDKGSGETTLVARVEGGRDTDACACPYTLEFYKSIEPQETDGCSEVTIYYNGINKGGIGQVGVSLQDLLPNAFTITEVETNIEDVFVEVTNGVGANYLEVKNWNLLLGENIIKVKAQVQTSDVGVLESQATMGNLFEAYDQKRLSDDPLTMEPLDPTALKIIDPNSFQIEDHIRYSCDLDTVYLSLPLEGNFQWSTGSTEEEIAVTENGNYSLTLTTDCFTVMDDIQVNKRTEPFFVSLGGDYRVNLGDVVELQYQTNVEGVVSHNWQVLNEAASLNCTDCPDPVFEALDETQIRLEIIDNRGCIFEDELLIAVNRNKRIYIPNAFSPNNDGINDEFLIFGDNAEILDFQIFNRWGSLLYQNKGISANHIEGWDGKIRGVKASTGIYFYSVLVRFPDGEEELFQGEVLLL